MKVVILAGGRTDDQLRRETGIEWRCELPFQSKTFLEIGLQALQGYGDITVVGGPPRDDVHWEPGGESFFESFLQGMRAGGAEPFLLSSCDLPFLTAESVGDFLERTRERNAALHYPIVSLEATQARFPGMSRTSLKLKEGAFTGGNVFLIHGERVRPVIPLMERAYAARKSPIQLAAILGLPTLIQVAMVKLLPGSVSIPALERTIGRALKLDVAAVVSPYPEIATDIDSTEQYAWVQTL